MQIDKLTPYAIRGRSDGKVDILFPSDGPGNECPCHYRMTARPDPGMEAELRRDYYRWKARAKQATERRMEIGTDQEGGDTD